ncbi:hypothetical protein [Acidithiobacillus ferrivorans]|uniref:Uncharacterized protein n=1 Tax=Acidithiobacillus ferrivorans TaxID=160808 RepID=A0A7T5BG45_9PROT|nr:hypothetical protein [Acidithiobacillus ferrivorans]QQD71966.1 hypothetical protein H2515_11080 [Acidithiobacillus ferrivorans]
MKKALLMLLCVVPAVSFAGGPGFGVPSVPLKTQVKHLQADIAKLKLGQTHKAFAYADVGRNLAVQMHNVVAEKAFKAFKPGDSLAVLKADAGML